MSSGFIPEISQNFTETKLPEQTLQKISFTQFLPKLLGFQAVVEGWCHIVMNVGHFDSQDEFIG